MEEEASAGSLAEAAVAVEKSLAELDLAAPGVAPGQLGQQLGQPAQSGLKMAPRPGGLMVGGMGEVRCYLILQLG